MLTKTKCKKKKTALEKENELRERLIKLDSWLLNHLNNEKEKVTYRARKRKADAGEHF